MIEIITPGTKKIVICQGCGCKFSFEKEDVRERDIDNYKAYEEYIICPQCQKEIILITTR